MYFAYFGTGFSLIYNGGFYNLYSGDSWLVVWNYWWFEGYLGYIKLV